MEFVKLLWLLGTLLLIASATALATLGVQQYHRTHTAEEEYRIFTLPTDPPEVSVIIPTYNRAGSLRVAVDSVLAQQGYPPERVEVIIVDDCSTDQEANAQVKAYYAHTAPTQVRWVRLAENQGQSAARNVGVAHARGEYVAFLDDDDAWLPPKLNAQVRAMLATPELSLVCTDGRKGKGLYRPGGRVRAGPSYNESFPVLYSYFGHAGVPTSITAAVLATHNVIITSSVLLRRALFLEVGGFNEQLWQAEDGDLWKRVVAAGGAGTYIPRALMYYDAGHGAAGQQWAATARARENFVDTRSWSPRVGRTE